MSCARSDETAGEPVGGEALAEPDGDGLADAGGDPLPVLPDVDPEPGGAPTKLEIAAEYVLWKPMLFPNDTSTFCNNG